MLGNDNSLDFPFVHGAWSIWPLLVQVFSIPPTAQLDQEPGPLRASGTGLAAGTKWYCSATGQSTAWLQEGAASTSQTLHLTLLLPKQGASL